MRRKFVLLTLAASLGGIFLTGGSAASAMPVSPADGQTLHRSSVVPASDPPPKVTVAVLVQAPLPRYTVVAGDTLTAIGARTSRTWQQLASFNHIANPNLIYVGDVETIPPANYLAGTVVLPAAPPATPPVHQYSAPTRTYTPPAAPVVSRSAGAPGSFQACVEFRESTNGAGSSNLYGILPSTWSANGFAGSPYTASPAQQDQAFQTIYARDGAAPWAPYDGC